MGLVATAVGAAVEWVVQSILGSFFTGQMQVWTREIGLAKEVEELGTEMRTIQMVLTAAERSKIDNKPLSESLDELKELLYDAEDVMDKLDYYRLQQQIEGKVSRDAACTNPEGSCASSSTPSYFQQVGNSVNHYISWTMHDKKRKRGEKEEPTHTTTMLPYGFKHDISQRINEIVNRLRSRRKPVQEVLKLKLLRQIAMPNQSQSRPRKQRQTTSLPVERKVYGRDAERDNIIELLTKGNSGDLGVLPLVGVGGVGKTTLARLVYHDQRIKDHFDLRIWVCVSDNFNEENLTREMLEHACKDRQGYKNIISFGMMQETLLEKIRRKRFLLILDDMWEDGDRSGWDKLLAPLKCNEAKGCIILATTRRTSVARMIRTMSKVEVNGLDETEFWSLFKEWAFYGNENQECNLTLLSIGKHIAKALKGNPLAARSVGALLNRSVSFEHWRKVLHKWRSLLEQDDDILAILKLSYEFLPVHLQQCFSYCSLFPKDHKFAGDKLVRAWISQNFVKCECHTERLEETGKQYLDSLVDWGFFEEVESRYVMHDLMHDLAEKVSSNECASIDGSEYNKISPSVRHLSIITDAYANDGHDGPPIDMFENILHKVGPLKKLRTLMFFGWKSIFLLRSLHTLCKESENLRLLSIYVTAKDISCIHNFLKPYHLRYLEFNVVPGTNIFGRTDIVNTSIPQALTQFYHLQVLDASSDANLAVPTGMNNLINLRHLIGHEKVHSTIASVGKLTSLQELTFKVQDSSNFNIGQLQSMNELIMLKISQLENIKTKEEATSARLTDKEFLQELSLSWDDNSMSPEPTAEKTRDDVLEGLEPHQNLKHLQLTRYSGATSPTWLANKVTSLQTLHLDNCREWRIVQSLEKLPVLRKLKLIRMWNLMEVSIPSYLGELFLVNMPKLEKCVGTYGPDLSSGLRVLTVKYCPLLNEFSLFHSNNFHAEQKSWFPSLNKLTIGHCHRIIAWKILPLEEARALKELELVDMPLVEKLSVPSLEKLVLVHMRSLQTCSGITASPPLQLSTFQTDQMEWISSLRKLIIHDCSSLVVSLPIPPSPLISYLSIKGLATFPRMEIYHRRFTIESNELSELDGKILPFHNLKGITSMWLQDCPSLISISSEVFSQLIGLEDLVIQMSPKLLQQYISSETIEENRTPTPGIPVLPSLKSLTISWCGIAGWWLSQMLPRLPSLESLELCHCPRIKVLSISQPTETSSLVSEETTSARDEHLLQIPCNLLCSLKRLSIRRGPDLEFSTGVNGGFARCTSLVKLEIYDCPNLVASLVSETNDNGLLPTSLEELEIGPFPANLKSFSPKGLPLLKRLRLCSSQHLKVVQLQHLTSLRGLAIWMNHEMSAAWDLKLQEQEQSGDQVGLVLPLSLAELSISDFKGSHLSFMCLPSIKKLELSRSPELVSIQLGLCTALEDLEIMTCKSLASIEGFQSTRNLRFLRIVDSPSLRPYFLQQMHMWSGMATLAIDDASVLSIPLCKQLTSLRCLILGGYIPGPMQRLTEEQERALQLLTSLRLLKFLWRDNLEALPANLRSLDSLEELHICGCPAIRRLPEMGLPPSLRIIYLSGCSEELCMECSMAKTEKLMVSIWTIC